MHGLDGFDSIKSGLMRWFKAELPTEILEKRLPHPRRYAHRPVALDIAVPSHRASSASGPADVSLEEKEVHHLLDGGHGILVLRQAHRPTADYPITFYSDLGRFSDLLAIETAAFLNVAPVGPTEFLKERLVTDAARLNKRMVEDPRRDSALPPRAFRA